MPLDSRILLSLDMLAGNLGLLVSIVLHRLTGSPIVDLVLLLFEVVLLAPYSARFLSGCCAASCCIVLPPLVS